VGNSLALPIYSLVWHAGRVAGSAGAGRPPTWTFWGLLGTLRRARSDALAPLIMSALWAALAASATAALAWALAWASRRPGPWRWVVAASVTLALATPGPVAGMALVHAYIAAPAVYNTAVIVIMAYVVRTLPYALLVLWPAVRALPQEYLDAAALDGYDAWGQVRRVALPLTLGALFAAWGVAFVLALGELPAANLVEPPSRTGLLAVRIWTLLHSGVESHLAGVGLMMLAALGAAGLVVSWAVDRLYATGDGEKAA